MFTYVNVKIFLLDVWIAIGWVKTFNAQIPYLKCLKVIRKIKCIKDNVKNIFESKYGKHIMTD